MMSIEQSASLSNYHMPASVLPGRTEHDLKAALKGGFDKAIKGGKRRSGHGIGSSRLFRTRSVTAI
jgi:hypothetical protein